MYGLKRDADSEWRKALVELGVGTVNMSLNQAAGFLRAKGKLHAAEVAYRELLELQPSHMEGLQGLAALLSCQGRRNEAVPFQRRIAEIEVDRMGVPSSEREQAVLFKLAMLNFTSAPRSMPSGYVSALFDQYAERFETHLLEKLHYRAHEFLFRAVTPYLGIEEPRYDILDLGCGTGLVGRLFHRYAQRLDGVDLSANMLEKARSLGVYSNLWTADLDEVLKGYPSAYDLIVAADVFVYRGDLRPVCEAAYLSLREQALFAFSVESSAEGDFSFRSNGRFIHSRDYLIATGNACGFAEIATQEVVLRYEQEKPVAGLVVILRKR